MTAASWLKFRFCKRKYFLALSLPPALNFLSSINHLFDSNKFKLKQKIKLYFQLHPLFQGFESYQNVCRMNRP